MGFEAAHLAGGEVGDDDDAFADELFGGVPLGDAGEDLAVFVAEVDFEAEEFVGLGDALGDDDLGDAEVDLDEVVDGDLWGVGDVGGCGGWRRRRRRGLRCGRRAGALGADGVAAADGGAGVGFGEVAGAGGGVGVGGVGGDRRMCGWWSRRRAWRAWAWGVLFHVGHDLGESFVCSGEDGGEGA